MKQHERSRKNILLTGASGKIGTVLTRHLLDNHFNVYALVKRDESYQTLAKNFSSAVDQGHLNIYKVDLCHQEERKGLISDLAESKNQIYGIIHNARSLDTLVKDENNHISAENFLAEFNLGVYAAYDLIWNMSINSEFGLQRAINVSSIYGVVATNVRLYENKEKTLPLHYGVVKSALIHLTKELAARLAEKNVTVNAVSYGGVEGRVDEDFKQRYARLCPTANMLSHDDLAGSILFLLSAGASAITGHNLIVDGGWTVW